jgi:hypothetical protein
MPLSRGLRRAIPAAMVGATVGAILVALMGAGAAGAMPRPLVAPAATATL